MSRYQAFVVTLALLVPLVVSACEKEKKDENRFIEFIKVEGKCYEDHVKQPANYEGEIVHWYDVTKNTHSRYGSVHNWDSIKPENLTQEIKNLYKYRPPFMIKFWDLEEKEIMGDELHLRGISENTGGGPQYEATCALTVIQRLNYLPSLKGKNDRRT